MDSSRRQRATALFHEASELFGEERRAFLERECAGDTKLLDEVLSLLASDEKDTEFLAGATGGETAASPRAPEPRMQGDTVGPYRLLRKVGEGGMGEVYEAEQREPVRRRVALKVIKRGMDTREVIARFELERQALALMSHRSIARVYEAGSTPAGRPYFAMEFVKGIPITDYCDRHKLRPKERLELFLQVCSAVQHAHQKGIIHRDLKPSNLLVKVEGDEAVPKVIDFGVAKATAQRLTEKTLFTELGQWVGTPEYMSPEQAELTSLDVDTRTDVYALGVVLYELMVGARPFDSETLRRAGFDEVRRVIREEEPPKPSTRLSSLGDDEATQAAKNRQVNAAALRRNLEGDLDAITMKALEKDRTRRYGSPMELAADVERYLKDEAVLASPPSSAYRARKFVRRHRTGVGISALLVVFLAVLAVAMSIQSARVAKERDRAELEAARAVAFSEFMQATILSPDPEEGLGREVTVAESLASARDQIDELSAGRPEVKASLQAAIGRAFLKLGRYDEAEPLLQEALENRERVLGPNHLDTTDSQVRIGELMLKRGDNEEAEGLFRKALEARRAVLGGRDPKIAETLDLLGEVLIVLGRYDEARSLLEEALAIFEASGPETAEVATTNNKLGIVAWNQERFADAESFYRETLSIQRQIYGNEHALVGGTLNNLGVLLFSTDDFEEAEGIFQEVLELQRKVYGEGHEEVATAMGNLAAVAKERGRYEEAEHFYRGALAIDRAQLGEDHVNVAIDMTNLGELLILRERTGEACQFCEQALRHFRASLEAEHWRVGAARQSYGYCLGKLGRFQEAEQHLLEGLRILGVTLGSESQRSIRARSRLAEIYDTWGKPERAAEYR